MCGGSLDKIMMLDTNLWLGQIQQTFYGWHNQFYILYSNNKINKLFIYYLQQSIRNKNKNCMTLKECISILFCESLCTLFICIFLYIYFFNHQWLHICKRSWEIQQFFMWEFNLMNKGIYFFKWKISMLILLKLEIALNDIWNDFR